MLIIFISEIGLIYHYHLSCTVHTAGYTLPYLTPMNVKESHVDVPSSQKNLRLSILIFLKCLNIMNFTNRHSPFLGYWVYSWVIYITMWYYVYKYAIQVCNACGYCTRDVLASV